MKIKIDNLDGIEIATLLQQHQDDMLCHSPVESVHALDLSALKSADVTFWSAWIDGELAGCGALKALDAQHGELKSMRTAHDHLRKGVAAKLLAHITDEARARGYQRISLETGTAPEFLPAQTLYKQAGFSPCPPFSDYSEDPYSAFFTLVLGKQKLT